MNLMTKFQVYVSIWFWGSLIKCYGPLLQYLINAALVSWIISGFASQLYNFNSKSTLAYHCANIYSCSWQWTLCLCSKAKYDYTQIKPHTYVLYINAVSSLCQLCTYIRHPPVPIIMKSHNEQVNVQLRNTNETEECLLLLFLSESDPEITDYLRHTKVRVSRGLIIVLLSGYALNVSRKVK